MKKLDRLADLFNRHWIWKIIIAFLPSVWLPVIVKYLGVQISCVTEQQHLTTTGWVITIAVYALSLLILFVSSYGTKRDAEKRASIAMERDIYRSTNQYYDKLIASVHSAHIAKSALLLESARTYQQSGMLPYTTLIDPIQQLKSLSTEIRACFHDLTAIPKDRIVVSMAYELPGHDWAWVDHHVVMGGLSLDALSTNQNTAFYKLIHSDEPMIYIPDKVKALRDRQYVSDGRDGEYRNIGSLVCWKVDAITSENISLGRLVVSISSYGRQFSTDDSQDVRESINLIFRLFEEQIIIELVCLYLLDRESAKLQIDQLHAT